MTAISNNNIAEAIYLAAKDSTDESRFFHKVVQFLAKRKLLAKAPDILLGLKQIINNHEGRMEARISSSKKINEAIARELKSFIAKRYAVKEVVLIENLDEKLLGGIKIEVRDEVIDLSIRHRIDKLQAYLTKSV